MIVPLLLATLSLPADGVVTLGSLDTWVTNSTTASIAFSGDGKRVALGSFDAAQVIDLKSGKVVRATRSRCDRLALSQAGDKLICDGIQIDVATDHVDNGEERAVTRTQDGKIAVLAGDPVMLQKSDGVRVRLTLDEPKSADAFARSKEVFLSPDGSAAVVRAQGGVSIFKTSTGALVGVVAKDMGRTALALANGTLVVGASSGLIVFDLATAKERKRINVPSLTRGAQYAELALTPDGKVLAVVDSSDLTVVDVVAGEVLRSFRPPALTVGGHIAITADGKLLGSIGGATSPARFISLVDGHELALPERHGGAVTAAAFSPDGARVATVAPDGTRIWSAADGKLLYFAPDVVGGVAMPDAHTAVVAGAGAARITESGGKGFVVVGRSSSGYARTGHPSKDGKTAWLRDNERLQLVNIDNGAVIQTLPLRIGDFGLADDGSMGVVAEGRGELLFGNPTALKPVVLTPPLPASRGYNARLEVSGDGKWMFLWADAGFVVPTNGGAPVPVKSYSAQFVRGTSHVVLVDRGMLSVVDAATGAVLATRAVAGDAVLLAITADGTRVAFAIGGQLVVVPVPS